MSKKEGREKGKKKKKRKERGLSMADIKDTLH